MNESELTTAPRLTQFSHGAGCGCKIAPSVLEEILKKAGPEEVYPTLLVGNESKDDAAVMELGDGNCLVSTTDFFMPIVDSPFDFGRIAATNAISDVYAMGGKPILAIAILGFPVTKLPVEVAREIISGAKVVCAAAGIPLAGGHSIDSPEPIFGLAVNGLVRKENIKKNTGAKAGDCLFLTKPLGTGILATAHKRGKIEDSDLRTVVEVMTRLNNCGEFFGTMPEVHAMTDVTGFGLLGHLLEMCEGSGVSARINYDKVPLIPNLEKYTSQMIFPDSTYRNWNSFGNRVQGVEGPEFITLCDPQTSGGLLLAVDSSKAERFIESAKERFRDQELFLIGEILTRGDSIIQVLC